MGKKDRIDIAITAVIYLVLLLVGLRTSESMTSIISRVVVMTLFALSFNFQYGYGGMIILGHSLFFGFGGYMLVILMAKFGMSLIPAILLTMAATIVAAVFVGIVCLRNYETFMFISMGICLAVGTAVSKWTWVGGTIGISQRVLPESMSFRQVFILIWACTVLAAVLLYILTKTPFVTMLKGVRENEERVVFLGVDVFKLRLAAYTISGLFASFAGILYAFRNSGAYTSSIDMNLAFQAVIMCVIGGAAYFAGPVVGAVIITLILNYVSGLTAYYEGILGLLVLLVVYFMRDGLISDNSPLFKRMNKQKQA